MTRAGGTEVSPFDRLVWPDGVVEHLLASGERRRELVAYFGEAEYLELVLLARQARDAKHDADHVVFLVPGIMGSQLGVPRAPPLPTNLIWIDPQDFHAGALVDLGLSPDTKSRHGARDHLDVRPLGVVVYTYLRLKLHLAAAGFTVHCFDYDWRRSVADSAALLAAQIARTHAQRVGIVGHSMGGLVARLAMQRVRREARIVSLGTPHQGSFAAVQALRGSYATVRRIAQLDPLHTADALVERAFRSFPSLYEMLPAGSADTQGSPDLLDGSSWPASGSQPDPRLLHTARELTQQLAQPDERVLVIAGVGKPTVTGVESSAADGFVYRLTHDGDGTVPARFATLPGAPTWQTTLAHSELPRDARVAEAIAELLRDGRTTRLEREAPRDLSVFLRISDASLHTMYTEKLDWPGMTPEQRRGFLDSLNEPPAYLRG